MAFVRIKHDGRVRLNHDVRSRWAGGSNTSLSMALARSLEVQARQIEVELRASDEPSTQCPFLHLQATIVSLDPGFWLPSASWRRGAPHVDRGRRLGVGKSTRRPAPPRMEWFCIRRALGRCPSGLAAIRGRIGTSALDRIKLKEQGQFSLMEHPRRDLRSRQDQWTNAVRIDVMLPGLKGRGIAISPVLGGRPKA